MLTGRTPFKGSTAIATCWKHLREQPTRPSILNPAIPRPVERVILCALEKDPQYRFPSARELLQAYKRSLRAAEQPETVVVSLATSIHVDTPLLHPVTPQPANGNYRSRKLIAVPAILLLLLSLSLSLEFYTASITVQKTPSGWVASVSFLGEKDIQHKHITPPPQSSLEGNSSNNTQNHSSSNSGKHGHKHKH